MLDELTARHCLTNPGQNARISRGINDPVSAFERGDVAGRPDVEMAQREAKFLQSPTIRFASWSAQIIERDYFQAGASFQQSRDDRASSKATGPRDHNFHKARLFRAEVRRNATSIVKSAGAAWR